jgi:hypothetical protein
MYTASSVSCPRYFFLSIPTPLFRNHTRTNNPENARGMILPKDNRQIHNVSLFNIESFQKIFFYQVDDIRFAACTKSKEMKFVPM